jgi:hypothetical protein
VCVLWLAAQRASGSYPLGIEPIFPALFVAALAWMVSQLSTRGIDGGRPTTPPRVQPVDAEQTRRLR